MKKPLVALAVTLLLAPALAQETGISQPSVEIRLSLVESRLGRLESDVSRLTDVPTQLARIESKLEALTEKADGQGNVLQSAGLMVFSALVGGAIGWLFRKK